MYAKITTTSFVCALVLFSVFSAGCSPAVEPVPPAQDVTEPKAEPTQEAGSIKGEPLTPAEATNNETPPTLEGTWRVTVVEFQGKKGPPKPGMPEVIEVEGGMFSAMSGGQQIPMFSSLKIVFPSQDTTEINLERIRPDQSDLLPCRIAIEGNVLRIAMPMVPANKSPDDALPRPESFNTSTAPILVLNAEREP